MQFKPFPQTGDRRGHQGEFRGLFDFAGSMMKTKWNSLFYLGRFQPAVLSADEIKKKHVQSSAHGTLHETQANSTDLHSLRLRRVVGGLGVRRSADGPDRQDG